MRKTLTPPPRSLKTMELARNAEIERFLDATAISAAATEARVEEILAAKLAVESQLAAALDSKGRRRGERPPLASPRVVAVRGDADGPSSDGGGGERFDKACQVSFPANISVPPIRRGESIFSPNAPSDGGGGKSPEGAAARRARYRRDVANGRGGGVAYSFFYL
jgi:hypothetical protein